MTHDVRSPRAAAAAVVLACLLAFAPAALASPPDLTWNGAGVDTSREWSNAGNWAGTTAPTPSESLGTVTFPQLTSCGGPTSCYLSENDVSGLSANAVSVDDTAGYGISGLGLALGAGGLTAVPGSPVNSSTPDVNWAIPLTLTADQSWSVTGANTGAYQGNVVLYDPVSGGSHTLSVQLADQGYLNEKGGMEVGAFTATGADTTDSGLRAALNGTVLPTSLNSSPAGPVSVTDVVFADEPNLTDQPHTDDIGPLTATGAFVQVGDGNVPDGILSVAGNVTLNAGTLTQLEIDQAGSTPSTDYSQLTATGDVALGGTLWLSGSCSVGIGSTATLITTSGTLSGTFANAPAGSVVPFSGCPPTQIAARIDYTSHSMTATIVPATTTTTTPPTSPPPTTTPPVGTAPTPTAPTPGKATIGHVSTRGTTASVPVACAGATSCTATLTLSVVEKTRSRKKTVRLGRARVTVSAGRSKTAKVSLNAAGKRLLARHRRLSVKLTLAQTTAGKTRTAAKTLAFKARK